MNSEYRVTNSAAVSSTLHQQWRPQNFTASCSKWIDCLHWLLLMRHHCLQTRRPPSSPPPSSLFITLVLILSATTIATSTSQQQAFNCNQIFITSGEPLARQSRSPSDAWVTEPTTVTTGEHHGHHHHGTTSGGYRRASPSTWGLPTTHHHHHTFTSSTPASSTIRHLTNKRHLLPEAEQPDSPLPVTSELRSEQKYSCAYGHCDGPQHFDSHRHPFTYSPPNKSHPVYIGIEILDVDRINDAENLHLLEVWQEKRLNTSVIAKLWATNEFPIPLHESNVADCLWTPSLVFENSTEKERLLPPTTILTVDAQGVLLRKSRYSLKVRCHMNLQIYPMDKHECYFTLRTFFDPLARVDLRTMNDTGSPKPQLLNGKQVLFSHGFTPSLFDITVSENATRYTKLWLDATYTFITVKFRFERRIIHSLLTVYIPSSLVVTLSWLQFWFDVEAVPGRMSLGIMSTLTIMTQILTNYEKAGNHVTAVDIWLFVCLIMVFLALMEYAVAYTISHYYDLDLSQSPPSATSNHTGAAKSAHTSLDPNNNKQHLVDGEVYSGSNIRLNLINSSLRNRIKNKVQSNPLPGALTPDSKANTPPSLPTQENSDQTTNDETKQSGPGDQLNKENELPALLHVLNNIDDGQWTNLDQIEIARLRVQLALDELESLLKEQQVYSLATGRGGAGGVGESERRANALASLPSIRNEQYTPAAPLSTGNCYKDRLERGRVSSGPHSASFKRRRRPYSIRRQNSAAIAEYSGGNVFSSISEVDYWSRYAFPIAFILFVIIYWIVLIFFKFTN